MNRIQKINGHPTFGVRFVVCDNLEHLDADYRNSGYTKSAAELAVSKAAGDVITQAGYDYEVDTIHRNWAGGQHYQFATLRGQVAVYLYAAETTDDGDDDDTSWRLLRDVREIPADVLAEVERAQNAAEAAMTRVAERINDEAEAE